MMSEDLSIDARQETRIVCTRNEAQKSRRKNRTIWRIELDN
jgi:hypothetical protein